MVQLRSVKGNQPTANQALLEELLRGATTDTSAASQLHDLLLEMDLDPFGFREKLRQDLAELFRAGAAVFYLNWALRRTGVLSWDDLPGHKHAVALHAALDALDLDAVPVVVPDQSLYLKDRAARTRDLFRGLGLKHIRACVSRGCLMVSVTLPARGDCETFDRFTPDDPAFRANKKAREQVQAVLLRAFPAYIDESDFLSDYFANPWYIR